MVDNLILGTADLLRRCSSRIYYLFPTDRGCMCVHLELMVNNEIVMMAFGMIAMVMLAMVMMAMVMMAMVMMAMVMMAMGMMAMVMMAMGMMAMVMMAMVMMAMVMMATMMVLVMVITVPDVLGQVGWLHQRWHHSFYRMLDMCLVCECVHIVVNSQFAPQTMTIAVAEGTICWSGRTIDCV